MEVQANSCIDRASVGETRIGRGVKIDNLVQVGHGSQVGEDALLCSQVGLAGSTEIGKRVILTGQVGVVGHCKIGEAAIVTPQSGVAHDIPAGALGQRRPRGRSQTMAEVFCNPAEAAGDGARGAGEGFERVRPKFPPAVSVCRTPSVGSHGLCGCRVGRNSSGNPLSITARTFSIKHSLLPKSLGSIGG